MLKPCLIRYSWMSVFFICILALPVFLFFSFSSRHSWIIFSASFVEVLGPLFLESYIGACIIDSGESGNVGSLCKKPLHLFIECGYILVDSVLVNTKPGCNLSVAYTIPVHQINLLLINQLNHSFWPSL